MTTKAITSSSATETRCLACGRKLTASTGYGPKCAAKIRQAQRAETVTAGWTPAQRDDAAELIEDTAIVPVRETAKNGTLYQAVSTDGTETYLLTAAGCTCPAGLRGKRCYHQLAARILRIASRRTATAKRADYVKAWMMSTIEIQPGDVVTYQGSKAAYHGYLFIVAGTTYGRLTLLNAVYPTDHRAALYRVRPASVTPTGEHRTLCASCHFPAGTNVGYCPNHGRHTLPCAEHAHPVPATFAPTRTI